MKIKNPQFVFTTLVILAAGWLSAWAKGMQPMDGLAAVAAGLLLLQLLVTTDTPAIATWRMGLLAFVLIPLFVIGTLWLLAFVLAAWILAASPRSLSHWKMAGFAWVALPWLTTEGFALGWIFRISGAAITAVTFDLLGLPVTRDGTFILVAGQPLAVDAACAGLDTLQAMLVAGLWLAGTIDHKKTWLLAVITLPLLAWIANTIRILLLSWIALTWDATLASGWLHTASGLLVIGLVFVMVGQWITICRRVVCELKTLAA